jgi:hypothetical protein
MQRSENGSGNIAGMEKLVAEKIVIGENEIVAIFGLICASATRGGSA